MKGTMEEIANTLNITKEEIDNFYSGKYVQVCLRKKNDNIYHVVPCFLNEVVEEHSDSESEVRSVEYYNSANLLHVRMRRDFIDDNYVFNIFMDQE